MAKRIVVASGKGGVGKTTLCAAMARILAKIGCRVLILDFDHLRSVDLFLSVDDRVVFDWGDAARGDCEPRDAILESDGVYMAACPADYSGLSPALVKALVLQYDAQFDYIFLDAPAGTETGFALACAGANCGIVVATPDTVCVRAACKAAMEMEKLGVRRCRLLINRAEKKEMRRGRLLNIDDVIDQTEVQLLGVVPEDKRLPRAAHGKTKLTRSQDAYPALLNVVGRMMGENLPLSFM